MRANMNQGMLSFVNTKRSTNTAWSDFDARFYDPQLGRWHVPDPTNQYASPYVGMGNNPACRVDPNGKWVGRIRRSSGNWLYGAQARAYDRWSLAHSHMNYATVSLTPGLYESFVNPKMEAQGGDSINDLVWGDTSNPIFQTRKEISTFSCNIITTQYKDFWNGYSSTNYSVNVVSSIYDPKRNIGGFYSYDVTTGLNSINIGFQWQGGLVLGGSVNLSFRITW
jgi:RHS repeat-associated protein